MRSVSVAAITIAAIGLSSPAQARDPLTDLVHSFFYYQTPPPPPAGNCSAVVAEVGHASVWYGEFSGKRYLINDRFTAFSSRGCFESEIACRVWQQMAINYADGAISYTSCLPGSRGG